MMRLGLSRHPLVVSFAVALGAAILAVPAVAPTADATPNDRRLGSQPNIVFVMLDDVSTGYMDAMPTVRRKIANRGVEFVNGITPTSLCCPSRAATLSGKLAHTTGVYGNLPAHGGWATFKATEDDTIATHLKDAGYRTGLFGKYLNGFGDSPSGYVPAGWNEFQGFRQIGYYNWTLGGTVEESYGDRPVKDYSTDVLTAKAVQFVDEEVGKDSPLFLYYSPFAAHGPMVPAPRHRGTWYSEPLDPAFNEKVMSDKPKFMRKKPRLSGASAYVDQQQKQHETLMAVDEGVAQIMDALGPETSNTLFIVMGDNGFLLGAHRLQGKNYPYVRSARVPMMMRLDSVDFSGYANRLTTNTDLTATMAEIAGVSWPMDGVSVFNPRTGTVMEQIRSGNLSAAKRRPAYCGYRTARYLYVEYTQAKGRELYDYSVDPNELHNKVDRDAYARVVERMRGKALVACSPTPYGFTWGG